MPRLLAMLLVIGGLLLFADAAWDQQRGVAEAVSPAGSFSMNVARRAEKPAEFRNLMAYQWGRASLTLAAGLGLLAWLRRMERWEPFSPSFGGAAALDELEKTMDEETEKRRRPLR